MRTLHRALSRAMLGAAILTLVAASGGCGSGGPGTYLVDVLDAGDEPVAVTTLLPRPGR